MPIAKNALYLIPTQLTLCMIYSIFKNMHRQFITKTSIAILLLLLLNSNAVYPETDQDIQPIDLSAQNLADSSKIKLFINLSDKYEKKNPALSNLYLEKALSLTKKNEEPDEAATILEKLGDNYMRSSAFTLAMSKYTSALNELNERENKQKAGGLYLKIAKIEIEKFNYEKAELNIKKANKYFEDCGNIDKKAYTELLYGELSIILNNAELGFSLKKSALKKFEQTDNIKGVIESKISLGKSFQNFGDEHNTLKMWNEAKELCKKNYFDETLGNIELLIGDLYLNKQHLADAMLHFRNALNIFVATNNFYGHAATLVKIGYINEQQHNINIAITTYKKASHFYELLNSQLELAQCYSSLGKLHLLKGNTNEAKKNFERSLEYSLTKNFYKENMNTYRGLSETYIIEKNTKQAYRYYLLYLQMYDSVISLNSKKELSILNTKFTKDKEVKEIEYLKKQKEISDLKFKNINSLMYILIIASLLIIVLSIIFYFSSRKKHKTNTLLNLQNQRIKKQKEEILTQRNNLEKLYHSLSCQKERIELQRDVISFKNKNITDGIKYAEMIQKAILPSEKNFKAIFPDSFLLYNPKDIVSGDFYMIEQKDDFIHFAAVDCTGHGVPGAFMSLVGFIELSEVIHKNKARNPSEILTELNRRVNKTLHQNHKNNANKEGMDLALCTYRKSSFELEFSGAFNPLYIVRNGVLHEYKGDPYPIGISAGEKEVRFTNHKIQMHPGDSIYIFTDGYIDQFGGPRRKKFLRKRFKNALIDNSYYSMKEQKDILTRTFFEWKGEHEQIDDVLVIGIKIPEIGH